MLTAEGQPKFEKTWFSFSVHPAPVTFAAKCADLGRKWGREMEKAIPWDGLFKKWCGGGDLNPYGVTR